MDATRCEARALADAGAIEVTRRGDVVYDGKAKTGEWSGPVRLRLAATTTTTSTAGEGGGGGKAGARDEGGGGGGGGKKRRDGAAAASPTPVAKRRRLGCAQCRAAKTPQWRTGPEGPKTLCNACGIAFLKARKAEAKEEEEDAPPPATADDDAKAGADGAE
jgi:hypothetical protein